VGVDTGLGVDAGVGVDAGLGVDTGTGVDSGVGVDEYAGVDTGLGVDTVQVWMQLLLHWLVQVWMTRESRGGFIGSRSVHDGRPGCMRD